MARHSQAAQGMKVEAGDIILNDFGMKGKIENVMVMQAAGITDVLAVVDYTRGTDAPNVICWEEIKAIRYNGGWVDRKGETVEV